MQTKKRDPWWTSELTTTKAELRELSDKRRQHEESHERYSKMQCEHKKAIEAAKRESWRRFVSEVDSAKSISDLVKIISSD